MKLESTVTVQKQATTLQTATPPPPPPSSHICHHDNRQKSSNHRGAPLSPGEPCARSLHLPAPPALPHTAGMDRLLSFSLSSSLCLLSPSLLPPLSPSVSLCLHHPFSFSPSIFLSI